MIKLVTKEQLTLSLTTFIRKKHLMGSFFISAIRPSVSVFKMGLCKIKIILCHFYSFHSRPNLQTMKKIMKPISINLFPRTVSPIPEASELISGELVKVRQL